MNAEIITLQDAEAITGIKSATLKKRIQRGQLPGEKLKDGSWGLSRSTVQSLQTVEENRSYASLEAEWLRQLATGQHTGTPSGSAHVDAMRLGMLRFWRRLSLCPAIRDITAENFRLFLGAMPIDAEKKRCGYASKVKTQQALISFARFLAREGLTSPQLAESIAAVPFKQVFKPQRTVLTRHRLEEAFALVEDVGKGRTKLDVGLSRCILALTALAGLRRSELIPLQLAHIDFDNSVLWVVDGKGHKTAPVGMQPLLVEELRRWLKLRPQSPRPELLLMRDGRPLTVWAIRGRIRRLSDWLGVPITPHGLRRTFITTLVQSGMDLASVKRNARHNHLAMTELYTMVDEQEAIDALKNFRPAGKEKAPGGAFIEEEVNTILPPAPQPEQEDRWKALERRLEEIDRL